SKLTDRVSFLAGVGTKRAAVQGPRPPSKNSAARESHCFATLTLCIKSRTGDFVKPSRYLRIGWKVMKRRPWVRSRGFYGAKLRRHKKSGGKILPKGSRSTGWQPTTEN